MSAVRCQGWRIELAAAAVAGAHSGKSTILVAFDDQRRISDIKLELRGGG